MTNLSAELDRQFKMDTVVPVVHAASGALWRGAAVQFDGSGQLQNLTGAGTTFAGFLNESTTVAGDRPEVYKKGVVRLTVAKATNWAETDKQVTVYASDGNTFTLTSTSNQAIGKVLEIESGVGSTSAVVWVEFEAVAARSL